MARDPLAHPERAIRELYAYVAYRVGDGPAAEDIVSDVLERALRYRESYDPSRGSGIAWLIGIARNSLTEASRGREAVDCLGDRADRDAEDVAETAAQRIDLHRAIARLDPRSRDLIELRYGGGLSYREIGAMLDLRTSTVGVAIHRALAQLHAILDGDPRRHAVAEREDA